MASIVNLMLFLPLLGAAGCLGLRSPASARLLALVTCGVTLLLSVILAAGYYGQGFEGTQFVTSIGWIDAINVRYAVGVDGLNLPLVLLTTALSVLVVLASWSIQKHVPAYMALYLLLLTGMLGVFLALDLVLFYVFFELSLVPMYFLIGVWGGPRRTYAAIKFFLYTLVGSVCLLIVMMGIYYTTGSDGRENTWNMIALASPEIRALYASDGPHWLFAQWAFWLSFIAFAIKMPVAPLHTWLPDAHVEAPTPISMILAGVLLKMGGYALMRITYPVFPEAASLFWMFIAIIGVFGILYGALCAMAQTDWKKLVAYSSVSHMGYVTLGLAVMTRTGFDGAYFQMIGHGVTSAMMFFMVGVVYERAHHREIDRFGGIWLAWPGFGGWSLLCFFAAMGLPGLCGFIGEVMVLLGVFRAAAPEGVGATAPAATYLLGALAAFGVVLTAGYILWMFQRIYMGQPKAEYRAYQPVTEREYLIMATLGAAAIALGVAPYLVFVVTGPTFDRLSSWIGLTA